MPGSSPQSLRPGLSLFAWALVNTAGSVVKHSGGWSSAGGSVGNWTYNIAGVTPNMMADTIMASPGSAAAQWNCNGITGSGQVTIASYWGTTQSSALVYVAIYQ